MTKVSEYRETAVDELYATLDDLRKQLFELTNQAKQSKSFEQPHLLRELKKNIARVLTVLKEKESNAVGAE